MGLQPTKARMAHVISGPESALISCKLAKQFEEAGDFASAQEALEFYWQGVGTRPVADDLPIEIRAELLLRAGTLTGWLGSAKQTVGAQEQAKDLISEGAALFESLGLAEKVAEARVDLAICYWREGALDEARVTLSLALDALGEMESEQRLRAQLNRAMVEHVATRREEALQILRASAPLFEKTSKHSLKGKFHNELGILLNSLGFSYERQDYIDQALVEFAAAQFHFEQAGHKRFQARVENNEGFLFMSLGRFEEAHQHLDRARALHLSVGDQGGAAGVDDTRAQAFLLEGKNELAEKTARTAVKSLEHGGEQSILAEALTTHGKALARLNQSDAAKKVLDRAIGVAEIAGDRDGSGVAALSLIEELSEQLPVEVMREYFLKAESALSSSQHRQIRSRLGLCARRLLVSTFERTSATTSESEGSVGTTVHVHSDTEPYSLEAEVHRFEANLIRQALEACGGSVTRAARMLGVTHQGLAFILNGRHKDLLSIRTPVKKRRRSIIRHH